jgi:hypothetical protein
MRKTLLALVVGLLLLTPNVAHASPLGDRIVDFCAAHFGQRVGNGQCAGLATRALRAAGASRRSPDFPGPGDYVWGRQVLLVEATPDGPRFTGQLSDVEPGDVIQYRDARFITAHWGHHTAVVESLDLNRQDLHVYQQNAGHRQYVTRGLVHVALLSHGWMRIYRPRPAR